jgi:hypothetical protein
VGVNDDVEHTELQHNNYVSISGLRSGEDRMSIYVIVAEIFKDEGR